MTIGILAIILQVHCASLIDGDHNLAYGVFSYKEISSGRIDAAYFKSVQIDNSNEMALALSDKKCQQLSTSVQQGSVIELFISDKDILVDLK